MQEKIFFILLFYLYSINILQLYMIKYNISCLFLILVKFKILVVFSNIFHKFKNYPAFLNCSHLFQEKFRTLQKLFPYIRTQLCVLIYFVLWNTKSSGEVWWLAARALNASSCGGILVSSPFLQYFHVAYIFFIRKGGLSPISTSK